MTEIQEPPSFLRKNRIVPTPEEWRIISIDYESGLLTNQQIADKHGVSEVSIRKRASRMGWRKGAKPVKDGILPPPLPDKPQKPRNPKKSKQLAITSNPGANEQSSAAEPSSLPPLLIPPGDEGNLLISHRNLISKSRTVIEACIDRLLKDNSLVQMTTADGVPIYVNATKEIRHLTAALETAIGLERQNYGVIDADPRTRPPPRDDSERERFMSDIVTHGMKALDKARAKYLGATIEGEVVKSSGHYPTGDSQKTSG